MELIGKYTVFIWDFDGTLFDTYPHTVRAYLTVLRECGYDDDFAKLEALARITLGEIESYLFKTFDLPDDYMDRVHALGHDLTFANAMPFDGAVEFLRSVIDSGGKNMIYTHRDHEAIEMLERADLADLFADAVIGGDGFPMKPAPNAILALLERNGVAKSDAIMIGDREIDVKAGANAGIDSCLLMPYDISAPSVATYKANRFGDLRSQ